MGKGVALQAAEKYPKLPLLLANRLKNGGNRVNVFPQYKIITFPTKNNWKNSSTYELIKSSTKYLYIVCINYNIKKIVMPKVGCSNGGLEWKKVREILYEKLENSGIDVTIVI